jgi:hypothetical protein
MIEVWYGDEQHFGHRGRPQAWVNVLGRLLRPDTVRRFQYRLDGAPPHPLIPGPDGYRLARPGDFNVELAYADLAPGEHRLDLEAEDTAGKRDSRRVTLFISPPSPAPALPLRVDWRGSDRVTDFAQVVDGLWRITPSGVRVREPSYDRALAFGDQAWQDLHMRTTVTFHGILPPDPLLDGGGGVIHAALALRWPGHDADGHRPHRKWWPLGATAEFRLTPSFDHGQWRIPGGEGVSAKSDRRQVILPEVPYAMEHRTRTLPDGSISYQCRLWREDEAPPPGWDLELTRPPGSTPNGGALLLAHYTDVTFGPVSFDPIS